MTPNQEEKCFQKAFTESREPRRHQIYSGISYSGEEEGEEVEEDGWETWRMSAGGKEGRWWEAGESRAPPHDLALPPPDNLGSTLLYLWLRTRRDQLRGVREGRGATCQVKLPPTTKNPTLLNWGMFYPWIRLHGHCEWIILWSPIKESLNFEVGCKMCLHAERSRYGRLFTWLRHVIQLENAPRLYGLHEEKKKQKWHR